MLGAWLGLPLEAQPPAQQELPEEARKRLDEILGTWDSEWKWRNAEGEVVRTMKGTETARYLIVDRVVDLTTQVEGMPAPSKAWMFYSFVDETFQVVSVDRNGDLWHLCGGLEELVVTSDPTPRPDGSTMQLRFTHDDEAGEGKLEATMEYSRDGGKTWTFGFHQTMTRRGWCPAGRMSCRGAGA